jgi:carboxypeptidase family protein
VIRPAQLSAEPSVTITNVATGQIINLTTNSSGSFNSGALIPGNYKTQVSAKGFSTAELTLDVLVGNTATVNVKLQIGPETQVVDVQDVDVRVNTQQPTVQGVLSAEQIEKLPLSARNFMDLAQLEPGVQIQTVLGRNRRLLARCPPTDRVRPASHLLGLTTRFAWTPSVSRLTQRHLTLQLRLHF